MGEVEKIGRCVSDFTGVDRNPDNSGCKPGEYNLERGAQNREGFALEVEVPLADHFLYITNLGHHRCRQW